MIDLYFDRSICCSKSGMLIVCNYPILISSLRGGVLRFPPSLLVWLDGPRGILKIYVFYSKLAWQCDTWCFIPITDNKTSWSEQGLGAGAPD